jgi:hypothetical protein
LFVSRHVDVFHIVTLVCFQLPTLRPKRILKTNREDDDLSEVHDFFGISMNSDGSGHGTRCSVFGATALV